jgi:hypothetical protein
MSRTLWKRGLSVTKARRAKSKKRSIESRVDTHGESQMKKAPLSDRFLKIDEIRLVSDLRIMHAKVNELFQIVDTLKRRYPENGIRQYADNIALEEDIRRVDEIYLWFVALKEQGIRLTKK